MKTIRIIRAFCKIGSGFDDEPTMLKRDIIIIIRIRITLVFLSLFLPLKAWTCSVVDGGEYLDLYTLESDLPDSLEFDKTNGTFIYYGERLLKTYEAGFFKKNLVSSFENGTYCNYSKTERDCKKMGYYLYHLPNTYRLSNRRKLHTVYFQVDDQAPQKVKIRKKRYKLTKELMGWYFSQVCPTEM